MAVIKTVKFRGEEDIDATDVLFLLQHRIRRNNEGKLENAGIRRAFKIMGGLANEAQAFDRKLFRKGVEKYLGVHKNINRAFDHMCTYDVDGNELISMNEFEDCLTTYYSDLDRHYTVEEHRDEDAEETESNQEVVADIGGNLALLKGRDLRNLVDKEIIQKIQLYFPVNNGDEESESEESVSEVSEESWSEESDEESSEETSMELSEFSEESLDEESMTVSDDASEESLDIVEVGENKDMTSLLLLVLVLLLVKM